MSGTPPSKSWLNRDWRDYVLELAEDIKSIQQRLPLIEFGTRSTIGGGGGGGGGSRVFPARIIQSSGANVGTAYIAAEKASPDTGSGTRGTAFLAYNLYEYGVDSPFGSSVPVLPPGMSPGQQPGACFNHDRGQVIGVPNGTMVPMYAVTCAEGCGNTAPMQDRILGPNTYYYFAAQLIPCFTCEGEDDGEGGQEPLLPQEKLSQEDYENAVFQNQITDRSDVFGSYKKRSGYDGRLY